MPLNVNNSDKKAKDPEQDENVNENGANDTVETDGSQQAADTANADDTSQQQSENAGTEDNTGESNNAGGDDVTGKTGDEPVYTKQQMQAIIDRQKKKQDENDQDELAARLEEAKKQGIEEGKIEQRRQQVAEEYGFSVDVIPNTMKGIDDFETGIKNFQANHRRNIVAVKNPPVEEPLIGGFINFRKGHRNG